MASLRRPIQRRFEMFALFAQSLVGGAPAWRPIECFTAPVLKLAVLQRFFRFRDERAEFQRAVDVLRVVGAELPQRCAAAVRWLSLEAGDATGTPESSMALSSSTYLCGTVGKGADEDLLNGALR